MAKTIVLKIGGSVLTDKTLREVNIRGEVIEKVANEIRELMDEGNRFILLHGVGSAGHVPVKEYELYKGFFDKRQLIGYAIAQNRVNRVRQAVLDALERSGVPGIMFFPSSFIVADKGRIIKIYYEPMVKIAETGIVPVLSGDMVADLTMKLSVCSGDQQAFKMAKVFNADLIIFGVDVDGVFDSDPKKGKAKLLKELTLREVEEIISQVGGAAGIDVSGGMKGKLLEALANKWFFEKGGEVWILNIMKDKMLTRAVKGETDGFTRITK
ncbi:MAG: amino acid kinase [Thermoprotei archaeon]|nr:MAG: amino acid kinase [Thermoprotei archaeon]